MPTVSGLEEAFAGRVDVIRLNALERENSRLQSVYEVRGHPSFVVLDRGDEVTARFLGPQDEATLREAMAAVAPE